MKMCPFCAEEIQDEALKCKHCGEFLDKPKTSGEKWYFKTSTIVFLFAVSGPLVLPLVWRNPQYDKKSKVLITLLALTFTAALILLTGKAFQAILNYYKELSDIL